MNHLQYTTMDDIRFFIFHHLFLVIYTGTMTDLPDKECSTPQNPINGNVTVYGNNMLAEYTCEEGFFLYGESLLACDLSEGKWTMDPPLCLAYGCPTPPKPSKGFVRMEMNNSIARFSCKRRHVLLGGAATLYCLGNRWSGYAPLCASFAVSGSPKGKLMLRNTSTISLPEKTYDFEDMLRESDQTCSRYKYIAPPEITNASFKTRYMFNEARRVWSTVANYTCDDGFMLLSDKARYLFCRNYKWWAPVKPECTKEIKTYDPCLTSRCSQVCIAGHSHQHVCACHRGYTLNPDGTCKDKDECLTNNGGCQQLCYNTLGSRFCSCRQGYIQIGVKCIDIDECSSELHNCPAQCINTDGSYTCNCTGVTGYLPGENRPCKDLNECAINNGGCERKCINTISSYYCRCQKKGYRLSPDRHNCTDVDECERYGKKICHHGRCVNTDGSFYCKCDNGYRHHRPSKQCIDINECERKNGGCEDMCVNTKGSYHCVCTNPGLQEKNESCVDIDECSRDNGGCEDQCINTHGSYRCRCGEYGYVVDQKNGLNCTTCKESEYIYDPKKLCIPCPPNSHTMNYTASSPDDCVCYKGFVGNPIDGVPCEDIDECSMGLVQCQYGCQNTAGSVQCLCPDGYQVHNTSFCIDLDECEAYDGICGGLCLNIEGSYQCDCGPGYYIDSDNYTCIDIDECNIDFNCSHFCINTNGSAHCSCPTGYKLQNDNKTCQDINECEEDYGLDCEDQCINFEGSYTCYCSNPGYKLSWDKKSCSDINECQEGVNYCEDVCINMVGSYKCACNQSGFIVGPDGMACIDFDECSASETNECAHICNNYPGFYNCSCRPGYIQKDNTKCEACPIGTFSDLQENSCIQCPKWSSTTEEGKASMADCQCIDGYRGNLSLAIPCKDIDECQDNNFGCEQHCQNMEGSAYCSCRRGYNLHENKKNCTDIDECRYKNHFCSDICENSAGSYTCSCREGFKLYRDQKYCIDINECYGDRNPCDQHCGNTWGSYVCGCVTRGYILDADGHKCIENRPKIDCPEDVLVVLPAGSVTAKVELPSDIFSDHLNISPEWITRESWFPFGVTKITVSELRDSGEVEIVCSFQVNVTKL